MPLRKYAPVLENLIGEMYATEATILPADTTQVLVVDPDGSVDADEVLNMARSITHPDYYDGIFG